MNNQPITKRISNNHFTETEFDNNEPEQKKNIFRHITSYDDSRQKHSSYYMSPTKEENLQETEEDTDTENMISDGINHEEECVEECIDDCKDGVCKISKQFEDDIPVYVTTKKILDNSLIEDNLNTDKIYVDSKEPTEKHEKQDENILASSVKQILDGLADDNKLIESQLNGTLKNDVIVVTEGSSEESSDEEIVQEEGEEEIEEEEEEEEEIVEPVKKVVEQLNPIEKYTVVDLKNISIKYSLPLFCLDSATGKTRAYKKIELYDKINNHLRTL